MTLVVAWELFVLDLLVVLVCLLWFGFVWCVVCLGFALDFVLFWSCCFRDDVCGLLCLC